MVYHSLSALSESEQMYLLTVARINEAGHKLPVPLSDLAEALNVIPVSVHQMIKKLSQKNLVKYEPYKGVSLTTTGLRIAYQVLRSRRLWSVFLTQKLKLSPEEADKLACHLEHFTSPELCEKLAAYLNNPKTDPFGKPIPNGKIPPKNQAGVKLTNLKIGEIALINQVPKEESIHAFLQNVGIIPGAEVELAGIGENKELLVKTNKHHVYLSSGIAAQIRIHIITKENRKHPEVQ